MRAVFHVSELLPDLAVGEHGYVDFFKTDKLSLGYAVWPAGSVDGQKPHAEEEVYHVIEGRGRFWIAGEEFDVSPGSIIFVPAGVEHHFQEITEDLKVVVFWSPPHPKARHDE